MKTLSIIIPIYNTPEEYFSKCLASLQCAHAHEVEIIAVDDGSKPEFSAKIQKLIDSSPLDIQYYKKENGGQNSAREYGLERSDGQHIFFMDADDYVDTIVLDKIIALLKKYHPKVLAFNYDVRSPNGVLLEKHDRWLKEYSEASAHTGLLYSDSLCMQIYERRALCECGIHLVQGVKIGEDFASATAILAAIGEEYTLGECLYHYVRRPGSTLQSPPKDSALDIVRAIYYVGLLPFDLKKMLKDYKGDFSKCKSIELKVFPTKKEDIDDIFLNFAHHMNRQRAAINSALLSFDSDLPTNTISLGYSTSAAKHYDLPLDYFFDHETYIYAVLPQKVELPIAHLDRIELFSFTRDAPISIDSKVYFESYTVTRSKSSTVIRFGKGIQMSFSTAQSLPTKFNFTLSGTLSERIKDAEFMVAALSAHHYEINGGKIAFSEADCANLPTLQKKLSFLLDVKKTLEAVHATADLDCSSLSVTDNTNLSILRAALIDKEPIKMCSSQSLLRSCHIANLELLLWVVPTEENSEYHNIYDFNYVPLIYREFDKNDKEYPSTHFVMLNKDAMLKYCNIDYNALLDAVQHVPFSEDYSHSLNALLLEMLKAYDESKNSRIELLSTATTLALWIKDSDPYTEHPIAILNYLQSVKRSRILTSTEQAEILSLIEVAQDNESIYVGAYLLLDNPVAAKIHFDKLPEESQKFFESCPIYHFMPNGQPTISALTEG